MTENPSSEDILPKEIVFGDDAYSIALKILPWVRRHPRFTLLCALQLVGLNVPDDVVKFPYLSVKVQDAIKCLGCRPDGVTEQGVRVWTFVEDKPLHQLEPPPPTLVHGNTAHTRLTSRGFSSALTDPAPQQHQVDVCRAWLQEHARSTATIQRRLTSDSYRRMVTAWTKATGRFTEVPQVNEHTQESYEADQVYVSNGAMIAAALAEGYHARVAGTDAYFNLSLDKRHSDEAWKEPEEKDPVAVFVRSRKGKFFALSEAPSVPHLTQRLREQGCVHQVLLMKGKRGSLWFQPQTMPHVPMLTSGNRQSDVLTITFRKDVITLAEAANNAGVRVPRGRAPAALVRAITAAGYEKHRRVWIRKK